MDTQDESSIAHCVWRVLSRIENSYKSGVLSHGVFEEKATVHDRQIVVKMRQEERDGFDVIASRCLVDGVVFDKEVHYYGRNPRPDVSICFLAAVFHVIEENGKESES